MCAPGVSPRYLSSGLWMNQPANTAAKIARYVTSRAHEACHNGFSVNDEDNSSLDNLPLFFFFFFKDCCILFHNRHDIARLLFCHDVSSVLYDIYKEKSVYIFCCCATEQTAIHVSFLFFFFQLALLVLNDSRLCSFWCAFKLVDGTNADCLVGGGGGRAGVLEVEAGYLIVTGEER